MACFVLFSRSAGIDYISSGSLSYEFDIGEAVEPGDAIKDLLEVREKIFVVRRVKNKPIIMIGVYLHANTLQGSRPRAFVGTCMFIENFGVGGRVFIDLLNNLLEQIKTICFDNGELVRGIKDSASKFKLPAPLLKLIDSDVTKISWRPVNFSERKPIFLNFQESVGNIDGAYLPIVMELVIQAVSNGCNEVLFGDAEKLFSFAERCDTLKSVSLNELLKLSSRDINGVLSEAAEQQLLYQGKIEELEKERKEIKKSCEDKDIVIGGLIGKVSRYTEKMRQIRDGGPNERFVLENNVIEIKRSDGDLDKLIVEFKGINDVVKNEYLSLESKLENILSKLDSVSSKSEVHQLSSNLEGVRSTAEEDNRAIATMMARVNEVGEEISAIKDRLGNHGNVNPGLNNPPENKGDPEPSAASNEFNLRYVFAFILGAVILFILIGAIYHDFTKESPEVQQPVQPGKTDIPKNPDADGRQYPPKQSVHWIDSYPEGFGKGQIPKDVKIYIKDKKNADAFKEIEAMKLDAKEFSEFANKKGNELNKEKIASSKKTSFLFYWLAARGGYARGIFSVAEKVISLNRASPSPANSKVTYIFSKYYLDICQKENSCSGENIGKIQSYMKGVGKEIKLEVDEKYKFNEVNDDLYKILSEKFDIKFDDIYFTYAEKIGN